MSIIKCDKCGLTYELDNGSPCPTCKLLEEPKMNPIVKFNINRIAMKIFRYKGGVAFKNKVHDFSKSTSENGKECWNLALVAYVAMEDKEELLKELVK